MRILVFGAGAVGGVVGGKLFEHGQDVLLIARGAHGRAIREDGLRLETPEAIRTLRVPVALDVSEVAWRPDDVLLLATKSQDTLAALRVLVGVAPPTLSIACLQNGVENERAVLRRFPNVYAVCVVCPTAHLEPGVVQAYAAPITGVLDVGRYPRGVDAVAEALAAAFERATFRSVARADIQRWKYAKLLKNLGNALEAACGPEVPVGRLAVRARQEGEAALRAAGIDFAPQAEDPARGEPLRVLPIGGRRRGGGSTWQSLARGLGSVEVDDLNGEIVLLGRLHGVPTPVNAMLQRVTQEMAKERRAPQSMTEEDLERELDRSA